MTNGTDSRGIALDILMEVLEKGGYSHVVLGQALNKYQYLEKQERALITRLTEGTLEYLIQLDYCINSCSRVKVHKMKPVIRNILRMSVYQILYMDRIPDSAACNEAVKLAEKRKFHGLKGFVNGVLRTIARQKDQMEWPDDSIRYAMPAWIMNMWEERYGKETARRAAAACLEKSRMTVRFHTHLAPEQEILDSLSRQGVTARPALLGDFAYNLEGYDYLEDLEAFRRGWLQVQDVSSGLAGQAAAPAPGSYVIDVCGAPGGKSIHVAEMLQSTGMVEVRDLTEYKISLIEDNIRRTGLSNIRARIWDATQLDPESVEQADLVLADLPCSGLGIIGRKPDIKLRMTPDQLRELAELQRQILSVVWQYVKPGGTLIYSTCTIDPLENEDNREWFLEHFPFEPTDLRERLGEKLKEETLAHGYIQLFPGIHPCDGFFIAAFQRKR